MEWSTESIEKVICFVQERPFLFDVSSAELARTCTKTWCKKLAQEICASFLRKFLDCVSPPLVLPGGSRQVDGHRRLVPTPQRWAFHCLRHEDISQPLSSRPSPTRRRRKQSTRHVCLKFDKTATFIAICKVYTKGRFAMFILKKFPYNIYYERTEKRADGRARSATRPIRTTA